MNPENWNPNYSFILKCLAGVALFAILLALLSKPTYIVVAAASLMAYAASGSLALGTVVAAGLIFPILPIMASILLLTILAVTLSSFFIIPATYGPTYYSTWNPLAPAFLWGPSYVGISWLDLILPRYSYTPNTHFHRNIGSIFRTPNLHGHGFTHNVSNHPVHVSGHATNDSTHPFHVSSHPTSINSTTHRSSTGFFNPSSMHTHASASQASHSMGSNPFSGSHSHGHGRT